MVVVTGASGYLGRHVVDALRATCEPIAVVSPRTREPIAGIRTRHLDITQAWEEDLTRALSRAGQPADAVVHLAGAASVTESWKNPESYHRVNVEATERLVAAAQAMGIPRFVLASSVTVYGSPDSLPVGEDSPVRPVSPYAQSKARAEDAVLDGMRTGGQATILRFTNLAGSSARHSTRTRTGVLPAVAEALAHRRGVELQGGHPTADGTVVRDFLHVDDAASSVAAALQRTGGHLRANIASGQGTSLLEAAAELARLAGGGDITLVGDGDRAEASKLVMDVSLARRELSWTPQITIEDILAQEWERAARKSPQAARPL